MKLNEIFLFFLFLTLAGKASANGETFTPNMNIVTPAVGVTTGPQWAEDLVQALSTIDSHDHSAGKGVQVTPAGLNISSDLTCQDNNLTNLRSVRFFPQSSPLSGASDLGVVFESGVDLYYRDGNGNTVRITQGGSITGSAGSISGLVPPASASYVSGNSTFVWQSATNTPANLDAGSVILRDIVANSHGVTLNAPSSLASNYSVTFPASLPGTQNFMTLDSSGNIADLWTPDNSSIVTTSNIVQVGPKGIQQGMLANRGSETIEDVTGTLNGNTTISGISSMTGIVPGMLVIDTSSPGNLNVPTIVQTVNVAGSSVTISPGTGVSSTDSLEFILAAPAGGVSISEPVSTFNITLSGVGTSTSQAPFLSLQIVSTGRPIMVGLMTGPTSGGNSFVRNNNTQSTGTSFVYTYREGSIISTSAIRQNLNSGTAPELFPPGSFSFIDSVSSGTHNYTILISITGVSGDTIGLSNVSFFAYEM